MPIFIPKHIVVGYGKTSKYSNADSTLAYVIYEDEKGKLRKEPSWNSWRDHARGSDRYENVPMSGFLLNKASGGTKYSWDQRQNYARIWDTRGFEIEVTMENLIYLLQCSGYDAEKGFGELIYGYDKGQLVLVPTASEDYKTIVRANEILFSGQLVKAEDFVVGHAYRRKSGNLSIYLGKFPTWSQFNYDDATKKQKSRGSLHWFCNEYGDSAGPVSSPSGTFVSDEGVFDWTTVKYAKPTLESVLAGLRTDTRINPIDVSRTEKRLCTREWFDKQPYRYQIIVYTATGGSRLSYYDGKINYRGYSDYYAYGSKQLPVAEFIRDYKPYYYQFIHVDGTEAVRMY